MPTQTPYNSTHFVTMRPPANNTAILTLAKKLGKRLPFTTPNNQICTDLVKEHLPSTLDGSSFIDESKLSCSIYNTLTEILHVIAALSQGYWTLFFPFIFSAGIITDLLAPKGDEYYFLTLTPNPLNTTFIGIFIVAFILSSIWINVLKQKIKLPGIGAQKFFELNRRTGMITRFERNEELYSYPVTDFDCYLMTHFTNKGFPRYSLELYPRYKNTKKSISLSTLLSKEFTNTDEYLRLWNMIQRYMDTSQPLPDISILEEFRAKDPVTATYDKETRRNSHYWREMTDEEYITNLKQIDYEQENSNPLGGPLSFEIIDNASVA